MCAATEQPGAELVSGTTEAVTLIYVRVAPRANHDIGPPLQERLEQAWNITWVVLSITVELDDEVGPALQGGAHSIVERRGKTTSASVPDDEIAPRVDGDRGGRVARPVVNDDDVDLTDADQRARHRGDDLTDALGLFECW
jgi:hypothetical protein